MDSANEQSASCVEFSWGRAKLGLDWIALSCSQLTSDHNWQARRSWAPSLIFHDWRSEEVGHGKLEFLKPWHVIVGTYVWIRAQRKGPASFVVGGASRNIDQNSLEVVLGICKPTTDWPELLGEDTSRKQRGNSTRLKPSLTWILYAFQMVKMVTIVYKASGGFHRPQWCHWPSQFKKI